MNSVAKSSSPEPESATAQAGGLKTLRRQIVNGSVTLLASAGLASAMNFAYNIAVARLLGPTAYGHATAAFTLLMLLSAITLAFQIVCAKLVANHDSPADKTGIYLRLYRRAWFLGIAIGVMLVLARNAISAYLNMPDPTVIVLLGLGIAFYIPLGVRRGWIQGTCAFNALAGNFVIEGAVRLGGALLLIRLGAGVNGAVAANVAAIILAYFFAELHRSSPTLNHPVHAPFREGLQATVFFTGQVIINNFDIALVKHFFPSEEAGLYAAVALVGRLINMCSWSVVSTMFPVTASKRLSEEKEGTALLRTSLLLVFLILTLLILGLSIVPSIIWRVTFGAQFQLPGYGSISSLMILYAVASGVYSLSSVIIAYEMSRKIANTGWIQLAFSAALVLGICLFHASLHQVIMVQLVLMLLLLAAVLVPFLSFNLIPRTEMAEIRGPGGVRALRSLTEEAVIAEFLKNEFHHSEFDEYRGAFKDMVAGPNLSNRDENALRRALLFLRRGAMWRELPVDTQWFEVELTLQDLARVRVFPRAEWRRVAAGNFGLNEIVERIRTGQESHSNRAFFAKLQSLRPLVHARLVNPTVLLIGTDQNAPLTILDGNHRLAAAMLIAQPVALTQLRFMCGLSPRMSECCWYKTNVVTLWRYAKNLVRYMTYDPKSDIGQFLQSKSSSSMAGASRDGIETS
ncbi:MAG TPA: oligosaccharide flippase family protein [Verrucomicrobiae bacterium]|jgi:O-antigen/teichoic acid export membrane protein|nr:oligosaccharide flippase family protein [Verrucomicrobiae bacterium]